MIIQQKDLFPGMDREFVKEIMAVTEKETLGEGEYFFREGDAASHFYVLLRGKVKLAIGEGGQVVQTVGSPGEAFGWSALVGRDEYTASARCLRETKVLKMDKDDLDRVLEKDPAGGIVFMKRLAGTIALRLINAYNSLRMIYGHDAYDTFGSSLTHQQMGDEVVET